MLAAPSRYRLNRKTLSSKKKSGTQAEGTSNKKKTGYFKQPPGKATSTSTSKLPSSQNLKRFIDREILTLKTQLESTILPAIDPKKLQPVAKYRYLEFASTLQNMEDTRQLFQRLYKKPTANQAELKQAVSALTQKTPPKKTKTHGIKRKEVPQKEIIRKMGNLFATKRRNQAIQLAAISRSLGVSPKDLKAALVHIIRTQKLQADRLGQSIKKDLQKLKAYIYQSNNDPENKKIPYWVFYLSILHYGRL